MRKDFSIAVGLLFVSFLLNCSTYLFVTALGVPLFIFSFCLFAFSFVYVIHKIFKEEVFHEQDSTDRR